MAIKFTSSLFAALVIVLCLLPVNYMSAANPYDHNPNVIEELRVRDGLPNVFKKLKNDEPVTVLYLGGSITSARGWRPKTFAWLESQYPNAKLTHVNAAVAGTGADFAACRFEQDVKPHNADLVFVEFRVNVGGGVEARAIEGIIRQIWTENPETDICLVYTIGKWMIDSMEGGGQQYFFGKIMEEAANVYGIPSIDLAPEVLLQKQSGKLIFQGKKPVEGKLVFTRDGVHPIDAGHELYTEVIARSLTAMADKGTPAPHNLPAPMERQHLMNATLLPISIARTSGNWEAVDPKTDEIYRNDAKRTREMLTDTLKCSEEGATMTIEWEGTRLGLTHIPQGVDMEIMASTDGSKPQRIKSKQESEPLYAKFANLPELPQGKHTTTLTIRKLPEGTTFYIGQLLILRDPEVSQ